MVWILTYQTSCCFLIFLLMVQPNAQHPCFCQCPSHFVSKIVYSFQFSSNILPMTSCQRNLFHKLGNFLRLLLLQIPAISIGLHLAYTQTNRISLLVCLRYSKILSSIPFSTARPLTLYILQPSLKKKPLNRLKHIPNPHSS